LAPTTYEALLAGSLRGTGVADLLIERTNPDRRWSSTEWLLAENRP
jgi:hypothetical protein